MAGAAFGVEGGERMEVDGGDEEMEVEVEGDGEAMQTDEVEEDEEDEEDEEEDDEEEEEGGVRWGHGARHSTPDASAMAAASAAAVGESFGGASGPLSPENMLQLQVAILRDFTRAYSHHYDVWKQNHPNGVENEVEDGDEDEDEDEDEDGAPSAGSPVAPTDAAPDAAPDAGHHTPEVSSTAASPASSTRPLSSISIPATAEVMKAAKSVIDDFNINSSNALDDNTAAVCTVLASIVGGERPRHPQAQSSQPSHLQPPEPGRYAALNGLSPVRGFSLSTTEGHVPSPMDSEKVVRRARLYMEKSCEDGEGESTAHLPFAEAEKEAEAEAGEESEDESEAEGEVEVEASAETTTASA